MKTAALLTLLVLGACATAPAYEPIGLQKPDASYQKIVVTTTTTTGGPNVLPIYIKRFEDNGRLALCGYMLPSGAPAIRELIGTQMASPESRYILDSQVIGTLSFVVATEPGLDGIGATASCVRTQTPWAERLKRAPYRVTFPPVWTQS